MFAIQVGKTGFYVTKNGGISRNQNKIFKFETKLAAQRVWLRDFNWAGLSITALPVPVAVPVKLNLKLAEGVAV